MKPVYAFSPKGKFVVAAIRCVLFFVYLIKGRKWTRPRKNFNEDPLSYSLLDGLYFAYKYYFKFHEFYETPTSQQKINADFNAPHLPADTPVISITAAGDLMPYKWINTAYCRNLWDDIGNDFFSSDIVTANLETPVDITQPLGLVPELMLNHMEFNGDASMFDVFNGNKKYHGFDVLSTANNHAYDKGDEGVINTITFLEKQNIKYCGTSVSWDQRNNIPIIERNGIKIAFVAYTYSLNHLKLPLGKEYLCNHIPLNTPGCDLSFIKKQVINAHEQGADMVIASVHYGNAYQLFPSDHVIDVSHRLFDECGVDIILGSHAHNIQPVEYYDFTCPVTGREKQGFATYCMGDFVAYDIFTLGHLPVWFKIDIAKTNHGAVIKNVEMNPVYTLGIYKSMDKRELRFLNAKKLWKQMEKGEEIGLPSFHRQEAEYLKKVYEKVFVSGREL